MKKTVVRKKAFRNRIKQLAKEGFMNDAEGKMIKRSVAPDNAMRRHYYPQELAV